MKKLLLSGTLMVLCCLSSCQQEFIEKMPSPQPTGAARIAQDMSDADWIAEGYTEEVGLNDLPTNVQAIMNHYFWRLSQLEELGEFNDDQTMLGAITAATNEAKASAENLAVGGGLTAEQKTDLIASFDGTAGYILNAFYEVEPWALRGSSSFRSDNFVKGNVQSHFIFGGKGRKFWRAVLRIVVAVAVTAIIVAIPIAAVAAVKAVAKYSVFKSIALGAGVAKTALIKGATLGSFKISSALATGFAAGVKNAEKNWSNPWQGSVEFLLGIKFAPIYI